MMAFDEDAARKAVMAEYEKGLWPDHVEGLVALLGEQFEAGKAAGGVGCSQLKRRLIEWIDEQGVRCRIESCQKGKLCGKCLQGRNLIARLENEPETANDTLIGSAYLEIGEHKRRAEHWKELARKLLEAAKHWRESAGSQVVDMWSGLPAAVSTLAEAEAELAGGGTKEAKDGVDRGA